MASKELISTINSYENFIENHGISEEIINAYVQAVHVAIKNEKDTEFGLQISARAKELMESLVSQQTGGGDIRWLEKELQEINQPYKLIDLYYEVLKLESFYKFESFIYYIEKNRPYKKRFYQPRRNPLCIVVQDLQDLEDEKIKFLGDSQPSRSGKSTTCILFLLWIAMKRPNSHSAMGGHSGILAKGFYKELLNFITTPEYTFKELFDFWHPEYADQKFPTDKSGEPEYTITLGDPDRFATITCRGIDGTWTGAIDVSSDGYLYIDDLVRDREHSLSPRRMEGTFQEYLNKMVDRKNDGARELMVGTLWNVLDPLERIRKQYEGNPEYRFRKIPALNENDESNFDYEINGFSTQYYHEMRDRLDNAEWMAKFQQEPYVREGILFGVDELRYFNGILPETDHRIIAVTDVALGGGDSLSMPIGAEYANGDVYIFDWVFNKGVKEVTLPIVVGKIIGNEIRETRFEANQGGDLYCGLVDEMLQKEGYKCSCSHRKAPNKMEKTSKIIAYSGDVKRKFVFLQPGMPTTEQKEEDAKNGIKRYYRTKEYQAAMEEFTTFVTIGTNDYDDAVDGITQLEMFIENPGGGAKAEATQNPFRTGGCGYGY